MGACPSGRGLPFRGNKFNRTPIGAKLLQNPEGDMRDIKVGDYVTWRPRPNAMPVTGCKVLEFGETEDGQPAARLDCGRLGEINALVEHLTLESDQD
jgi:hypothetical protein